MTCRVSDDGAVIVCGPGGWRVAPVVFCPWCLEKRRCLERLVFGGWCGSDFMCGTCGSVWDTEGGGIRKISEDERDANVAKVAAKADPKCWTCHDSGWIESPIDESKPCTHEVSE